MRRGRECIRNARGFARHMIHTTDKAFAVSVAIENVKPMETVGLDKNGSIAVFLKVAVLALLIRVARYFVEHTKVKEYRSLDA